MSAQNVSLKSRIEICLAEKLEPEHLVVMDESAAHVGHADYRPGEESHFRLRIVSKRFVGQTRIQRHRLIHEALHEAFAGGIHALAIDAAAPGESIWWE